MKISMIMLCFLISISASAQEDWSLKRSTLKMKETAPVWPGCESNEPAKINACFNKMLVKHIQKNFRYPSAAADLDIHGKVFVFFLIDKNGIATKIKTRGPDKLLETEAARIISILPKMDPGMQRGRPVGVPYSIPINFKLEQQ